MAILSYVIAASPWQKAVDRQKLETVIWELLNKQLLAFPAAIFIGEAHNNIDPGDKDLCWKYIIPNRPDQMLQVMKDLLKEDTALAAPPYTWYYGDDKDAFKRMFDNAPFGQQDCCLCFAANQTQLAGWDGAVIYILTHHFPMEFMDPIYSEYKQLLNQPLAHYLSLYCSRGLWMEKDSHPLESVLKSYFGPDMILVQSVSPDSPFWSNE